MVFKRVSEFGLKKLKKKRSRQACLDIIEQIENTGVVVDLTKYSDTIEGFIDGIREYQRKVPVEEPDIEPDDEDKEQLDMNPSEADDRNDIGITDSPTPKAEKALNDLGVELTSTETEPDVKDEETTTEPEEPEKKEEPKEEVQTKPEVEPDPDDDLPPYNPSPNLPDWRELPADTPKEFVRQTYVRLLEREPDSGGESTYVTYVKSGMPREQILKAFKRGPEYKQLQRMKRKAGKL